MNDITWPDLTFDERRELLIKLNTHANAATHFAEQAWTELPYLIRGMIKRATTLVEPPGKLHGRTHAGRIIERVC